MVRRFRRLLLLVPLSLLGVSAPLAGCGGDGGPAAPSGSLCSRIGNVLFLGFAVLSTPSCSSRTESYTNHVRDSAGRVTAFDFDIQCVQGSSERLVGRVSNLTFNEFGEVRSWSATINGQVCRRR